MEYQNGFFETVGLRQFDLLTMNAPTAACSKRSIPDRRTLFDAPGAASSVAEQQLPFCNPP
jgi:hypothetical protein